MPWTERVASGGPTSGRLRWVRNTTDGETWVAARASTHTNILWKHTSADAVANYSAGDFGGSKTDEYHSLSVFQGRQITIGGRQENGATDLAYQTWRRADLIPGTWNIHDVAASSSARGSALGFAFGVVTNSGISSWVLTTYAANATTNAYWLGGASMPGTSATDLVAISTGSDIRGTEGCLASQATTPALFGALIKTDGTILVSRLSSGGQSSTTTLPTGWTTGEDIRVGQGFCLGTSFVVPVYNATDGNTTILVVSPTPTITHTQVVTGEVVGGCALADVGYLAKTDGTLLTGDGTGDFTDASDSVGASTLLLSLGPEGTSVTAWTTGGKVLEYTPATPSAGGGSRSWGRSWGLTWGSGGGSAGTLAARAWEGWTESEYTTYLDSLVSTHTAAWQTEADSATDDSRHAIAGLVYGYSAVGTSSYKTLALDLVSRVAGAWSATDLTSDLRLASGLRWAATVLGDASPGTLATTILETYRNTIMSTGQTFRVWSYDQINATFQLTPDAQGRWQGQSTFAARIAKGYDQTWADDIEAAFRQELSETPGYWGAGWTESYAGARSTFKAGREVEWIFLDLPSDLRDDALAAWNNAQDTDLDFFEFIDGTTQTGGFSPCTQIYQGWTLLSIYDSQASTLQHQILDAVSTGDTGIGNNYYLNYSSNGVRQVALVGGLLYASKHFS